MWTPNIFLAIDKNREVGYNKCTLNWSLHQRKKAFREGKPLSQMRTDD